MESKKREGDLAEEKEVRVAENEALVRELAREREKTRSLRRNEELKEQEQIPSEKR